MPKTKGVVVDKSTVESFVAEYAQLSKQSKIIEDRKKVLSEAIKAYAQTNGTRDDKGSLYCESDYFTFGAQCKKSISLDEDKAMDFLESKGFTECIRTVPKVDEDALEKRVSCGDITPEEFESITKSKVTYAVSIKAKETVDEMPEVQQRETVAASRRKPALKKRK